MTAAQSELIEEYAGYARRLARERARNLPDWISVEELETDAMLGLMHAARNWSAAKSNAASFRTFAAYRIQGAITDGIRERDWLTRADRAAVKGLIEADEMPLNVLRHPVSLDVVLGDGNLSLLDRYAVEDEVLNEMDEGELARLKAVLHKLPARQRMVVSLYYYEGCTMRTIGEMFGISESRVSQIHTQVLRQLRRALERAR